MKKETRPVCNARKMSLNKHKLLCIMMLLSFMFITAGCSDTTSNDGSVDAPPSSQQDTEPTTPDPTTSNPTTPEPTTPDNNDNVTMGQKNALGSAKNYLQLAGFSYNGLVEQLEFEQYSHEDAVWAADNCGADWNAEAAEAAKAYLELMPMSRGDLIDQLKFDGFTEDQAAYAADQNGY